MFIGEEVTKIIELQCHSARIGSFKFTPKKKVLLSNLGLTIYTFLPSNPIKKVLLSIQLKYITEICFNLISNNAPKIIIFYVTSIVGENVRRRLQMVEGTDAYFDADSPIHLQKCIILFPVEITEDCKNDIIGLYQHEIIKMELCILLYEMNEDETNKKINKIFTEGVKKNILNSTEQCPTPVCNGHVTLLADQISENCKNISEVFDNECHNEELTTKEANDIMIRTCPEDSPRKEISIVAPNPTPVISSGEVVNLLTYPPAPAIGGLTIQVSDFMCLADDQFLNDIILDFYLKYLHTEVLTREQAERVYIFSSFFYSVLTSKSVKTTKEKNPNLRPSEKQYMHVENWTKNVNIFEKDYLIIPINEKSHWFLAIICFPGLEGIKVLPKEKKKCHYKGKEGTRSVVIGNTTITLDSEKEIENVKRQTLEKCDDEENSDWDKAETEESELEESESDSEPEEVPKKIRKTQERIKQPCILIFNSVGTGRSMSRVVATLREYLTCEYCAKHPGSDKIFSKDNIKAACPRVPQQMNLTDCGLYVLQYVESFFKNPISDYHLPMKEMKDWFPAELMMKKREDIANLIRTLMLREKRDMSIVPDLQF